MAILGPFVAHTWPERRPRRHLPRVEILPMTTRIHFVGEQSLTVDEEADEVGNLLQGVTSYLTLHVGSGDRTVLVNPANITYVEQTETSMFQPFSEPSA
jgi:hypothetical protein